MPPQYLPAAQAPTGFSNLHGRGQSGKADRSCPARTEGTGISFRRLRPVLLSSPPVPSVCAPPPACRAPSAGRLPSCGPSQRSPDFGPSFRPSKNSPAVSRQKQLRRHAEKKRRESPHAFPLPDGAQPSCSLPARPPVPFRQGKRGPLPVVMLSLYQLFHILVENTPVMLSSSSFPFLPSIKIHKKVEFIFFEITIQHLWNIFMFTPQGGPKSVREHNLFFPPFGRK